MRNSLRRQPVASVALLVVSAAALGGASAPSCLCLETGEGEIAIELDAAAAPGAVAAIERLARGPIYRADLLPVPAAAEAVGYFDGLAFDYAKPRAELRLAARHPAAAFTVEAELDAAALGLDRRRVADAGEAMDRLQMDLLPARVRPSAERRPTARLAEWAERFERGGHDPSFLIGATHQELLEAIGYRFRTGLASRPALRGAVALVPASPTEAILSLAILLADHPRRTGRWVVVGQIVSGLDLADTIAARPLAAAELRDHRPLSPVRVDRALLRTPCSDPSQGGPP